MNMIRNVARFLAYHEIWPVGLCVAASFISARLLPVALIITVLFWIIRWIATGHLSQRTPADWAILLLVLLAPVTLWATALPEKTAPQVLRLLTGVALYYALVNWTNSTGRLRWLAFGIAAVGLLLALFSSVSVTWPMGKLSFIPPALYNRFSVLVADTVTPNVMAGSLVILLPLPLSLLLIGWKSLNRYSGALAVAATVCMVLILFLTKSRGGWMAFAAVVLLLFILRWRWGWLSLLAVGLGVGVIFYFWGFERVGEFFASSDTLAGMDGRIEVWSRAIFMIQDFPFTGIGMGSFTEVADTLYPFFLAEPGKIAHAHNLFFQVAVDLGVPGLVAWLALLMLVITQSWHVYRYGKTNGDALAAGLGAGLLCSQVALIVHGLTDAVTWGMVRPAPLVWLIWGLAITGGNLYRLSERVAAAQTELASPPPEA